MLRFRSISVRLYIIRDAEAKASPEYNVSRVKVSSKQTASESSTQMAGRLVGPSSPVLVFCYSLRAYGSRESHPWLSSQ